MLKHLEGARLGLFIFLGTVLIVLSIFLIGNRESLFVSSIYVKTYFTTVEGLKAGAPVRMSGYTIGSVRSISLANDTSGRVEVEMRIETDVRQFLRLDSEASVETEGLVGKKIVNITAGSPDLEIVAEGGIIKSKDPINITAIIRETRDLMAYLNDITKDFSSIVAKINSGEGTIGKLVNDDELYTSTVSITKTADTSLAAITNRMNEVTDFIVDLGTGFESIVSNVDTSITEIKMLIDNVKKGEGVIGALFADESSYDSIKTVISNLVSTTNYAADGAASFAENMEALKHNWLFKAYFEERGYWDKAEFEVQLDNRIEEVNKKKEILEQKIQELKELEKRVDNSSTKNN
ncbi:MAG: MCE family protein [Ignavibacteriae bacterium]|jgi:phospholipid/cholesterol/gamma-HCH transport system substrate-binding protein|nr:MCE family protein [Ignavibacteriota bacterium]NOG99685.1 MCE family protein [Ignavibacteriota bacterium]